MFGEVSGKPIIKICCGPRCGAEPGHRAIYAALEKAAALTADVRPVMCQGLCGSGVTLVVSPSDRRKIRDVKEAARQQFSF